MFSFHGLRQTKVLSSCVENRVFILLVHGALEKKKKKKNCAGMTHGTDMGHLCDAIAAILKD